MAAAATDGNGKPTRADPDDVPDQRVIARMVEMRGQGYSFRDIASALTKQGFAFSAQRVKDILEARQERKQKQ